MRLDKFTQMAQEAVLEAQSLAQKMTHPSVEPEHLLSALVTQEGGVVLSIIKRIGRSSSGLEGTAACCLTASTRHWARCPAPADHRSRWA
jgi:ATP-dependent Clp protease ATP-binding subunit ClpA